MERVTRYGEELLANHTPLKEALRVFYSSPWPERYLPGKCIGAGRFSYTFKVGSATDDLPPVLVKISSATTSRDWFLLAEKGRAMPLPAEDLTRQFDLLEELRQYLQGQGSSIQAPNQYLAALSSYGAYMLVQEYMDGWVPISDWCSANIDGSPRHMRREGARFERTISRRIRKAVRNFRQRDQLNDLLRKSTVHGGNILLPFAKTVDFANVPLCIIDQPGIPKEQKQRFKEIVKESS